MAVEVEVRLPELADSMASATLTAWLPWGAGHPTKRNTSYGKAFGEPADGV